MPQSDTEVLQWFFHLDPVVAGYNWPINVTTLCNAKRNLDACIDRQAPAAEVLTFYEHFAGAVGPSLFTTLLTADDALPEVNVSGQPTPPADGNVVLYVDKDGKAVVATPNMEWGVPSKLFVM